MEAYIGLLLLCTPIEAPCTPMNSTVGAIYIPFENKSESKTPCTDFLIDYLAYIKNEHKEGMVIKFECKPQEK